MLLPRAILPFCALSALACQGPPPLEGMPDNERSPNLIVIFVDDLGYGDLGCYGSTINRTPNVDRLARQGMRLTDFYVASSVCTPSRAALLTGCYPQRVGLHANSQGWCVLFPKGHKGIADDEVTLAESLAQVGYATACVGKWHLGDQPRYLPTRHGFEHYFGIPYSNDMGGKEGGERPPLPLLSGEEVVDAPVAQHELTRRYTDESLRFIRENSERPFFLYLPHTMVHLPLRPGQAFAGQSANGAYGDALEEIDASTGELMDLLDELEISEHTLVLFTSDNGSTGNNGGSNAPLRGRKGQTWEGGQRVPCVVRWPGRISAGSECSAVTATLDLFPTFAGLVGAACPDVDGGDIAPLLFGVSGAESPHEAFFYYQIDQLQAVRSGRWKLHLPLEDKRRNWGKSEGSVPAQLFDLKSEIGEQTNLAERYPEVVARLTFLADGAREDLGDVGLTGAGQREAAWVEEPVALRLND